MVKTLVSLAVSMTAGAMLLSLIEPQPADLAANRNLYGWAVCQLAAQRAVGTGGANPPVGWSAVEVLALTEAAFDRTSTLAATAPPDNLHFLVSPEGGVQALMPWRRQQAVGQAGRVIRIGVRGAARAATLPVVQCRALRALLLELVERAGPLPVRVVGAHEGLVGAERPVNQTLRTLLAQQGFAN
jgi:hypothetical protein